MEYVSNGGPPEWGPHLFFVGDVLVGTGGWKGPPVLGAAEIGYAVAPCRQGHGIATAAARHLLAQGRDQGLRKVIAHTLPEESASTAVLRRCGFLMVGTVDDPEEGSVWRWEVPCRGRQRGLIHSWPIPTGAKGQRLPVGAAGPAPWRW